MARADGAQRDAAALPEVLEAWVRRREEGEPLAWIVGTVMFAGARLFVDRGVYVPRPQTEELARQAAALLPDDGAAADLCTGSGAVAAHLLARHPAAAVVGVDVDARAVRTAARNGVPAVVGDLDAPLRGGWFDVVTAVAPYVPTGELRFLPADVQRHEPRLALDGGHDGLALVRRIVGGAARLLHPGGWLLVEIGGEQLAAIAADLGAAGFGEPDPWSDDDGDLRGIAARRA